MLRYLTQMHNSPQSSPGSKLSFRKIMNFVGAFRFFTIAASFAIAVAQDECFTADNCDFYTCLESNYNCGPGGYPIGYGLRICEAFIENQDTFNEVGQSWLKATRLCLQDALVPISNNPNNITCDALKKIAYDSHPPCWTQPGNSFCNIGLLQIVKVVKLIGIQLTPEYFQQALEVLKTCGSIYYSALEQILA